MESTETEKILAIDIGGSHIKGTILDVRGNMITAYERKVTPIPSNPENVINTIKSLADTLQGFTKVSVGFPGYIKNGVVITAPNLDSENWKNFNLKEQLTKELGKPVQVVNDADLQGIGVVDGKGFEMVVTLGTGFGTALLYNGKLLPHLELAHHPISKSRTYDEYIGEKALQEIGEKKWNKRMFKVLTVLKTVFNYDHLYISGGNAGKLKIKQEQAITIVTNKEGIKGGAKLWEQQ